MTRFTIRAQNFRVLERLEWSPEGVCLLSGANGTGKSTVLDVLQFLRTLFERGHEAAFLKVDARYFRNVGVPESEPVVFELRVSDLVWKLRFPMAAGGIKDTFGEELYRGGQLVLRAEMFGRGWELGGERLPLDKVRCCAKVLWDRGDATWMQPLVDAVTGIHVYESYELRKVKRSEAVELRQDSLHTDGANLWSVLAHWKASAIRSEGRFDWVMTIAREAFPGQISTIEFERGFPVLYPPGAPDPDRGLPPERAADGLLTGLLHLTATAGAPPGSLIAFDELENQLHPHAIRTLLAAMRARADAQELTVVVTTHSPVVMNEFRDELEHVFVLERGDPARPLPIPLTELHTEEWLAQAKLGTLYERLAFASPLPPQP
ncbi:MAG TPA: AAA family ATPase [Kofleriaceae bacterium]|nr:AAA family ATPase [Kofleriaceae bacterium]